MDTQDSNLGQGVKRSVVRERVRQRGHDMIFLEHADDTDRTPLEPDIIPVPRQRGIPVSSRGQKKNEKRQTESTNSTNISPQFQTYPAQQPVYTPPFQQPYPSPYPAVYPPPYGALYP
ncbi:MAG: hypothetical protein EZS28_005913, partial [Streblomastix strix]